MIDTSLSVFCKEFLRRWVIFCEKVSLCLWRLLFKNKRWKLLGARRRWSASLQPRYRWPTVSASCLIQISQMTANGWQWPNMSKPTRKGCLPSSSFMTTPRGGLCKVKPVNDSFDSWSEPFTSKVLESDYTSNEHFTLPIHFETAMLRNLMSLKKRKVIILEVGHEMNKREQAVRIELMHQIRTFLKIPWKYWIL